MSTVKERSGDVISSPARHGPPPKVPNILPALFVRSTKKRPLQCPCFVGRTADLPAIQKRSFSKGASIYDVHTIWGFVDPFPPLCLQNLYFLLNFLNPPPPWPFSADVVYGRAQSYVMVLLSGFCFCGRRRGGLSEFRTHVRFESVARRLAAESFGAEAENVENFREHIAGPV